MIDTLTLHGPFISEKFFAYSLLKMAWYDIISLKQLVLRCNVHTEGMHQCKGYLELFQHSICIWVRIQLNRGGLWGLKPPPLQINDIHIH